MGVIFFPVADLTKDRNFGRPRFWEFPEFKKQFKAPRRVAPLFVSGVV